jgi:hypothetical protein
VTTGPEIPGPPGQPGEPDNRAVDRLILLASDPPSRLAALRALVEATVLLPGSLDPDRPGGPTPIPVAGARGPVYPFFTSRVLMGPFLRTLAATAPVERWLPCRELLSIAVQHGMDLVFNPGTRFEGELPVAHASDLLAGREPGSPTVRVQEEGRLRTAEPGSRPAALVEAVRDLLAAKPYVERAYLRWVEHEDGLHGYVIVFVSDAPREAVVDGLREMNPYALAGNQLVEALVVPTDRDLGRIEASEPIWPVPVGP